MQNALRGGLKILLENEKSSPEQYRKKLATDILEILHQGFHYKLAPLNGNIVENTLHISELKNLYAFLITNIVENRNPLKRPECPMKKPNQQSLARYEYKQGMCEYISGFGYEFGDHSCNYRLAFLEALANYCEYMSRRNNSRSGC